MSSFIEAAEATPSRNLLSDYSPPAGMYDEFLESRGQIRECWQQFAAALEAIGPQGLSDRCDQARRMLGEDGIAQGAPVFPMPPTANGNSIRCPSYCASRNGNGSRRRLLSASNC